MVQFMTAGHLSVIFLKHSILGFLYHFLSSHKVQSYWLTKINSGSVSNLNSELIKSLEVPIPYPNDPKQSLAEQARIVAILDKFDTLTHSISEGLPREIELRQKQYEYYRDLLLNFPKPEPQTEGVA